MTYLKYWQISECTSPLNGAAAPAQEVCTILGPEPTAGDLELSNHVQQLP
jgi:hypothetical protein